MASASPDHASIDVEEPIWIGILDPADIRSDRSALVTPLAYFDDGKGQWLVLQPGEQNRYFPNNGKLYVLAKDYFSEQIGRLCTFQVQLNPRARDDDNPWHSRYMTYGELEEAPLVHVLNWTAQAEHLFELPTLLDQGVETGECFSQSIYIRYSDLVYGPVQLELVPDGSGRLKPREYIRTTDTGGPPLLLRVYRVLEEEELLLGRGHFLSEQTLGSPLSKSDWSLPQVVLKRVLRASKFSDELEQDERLVDRRVSALAKLSSQHGPAAFQLDESTIERAQYLLTHQTARLESIRQLLADLDTDHPLLLAARVQEAEKRQSEIDLTAHAQSQILQERLHGLQAEIGRAENHLADLHQAARRAEEVAPLTQAGLSTLEISGDSSAGPLSQEGMRATLARPPASEGMHSSQNGWEMPGRQLQLVGADAKAPERFFSKTGKPGEEDLSQLKWVRAAELEEVRSKDVKVYTAALLAGLLPVTSGPAASSALRAAARLLAGDRVCRVAVPLTALAPLDLFGILLVEQGRFLPSAGGLADLLLEARKHPDALALVVFEGIDRVPAQPVYMSLLQHYREVRRAVQQVGRKVRDILPLELFHPQALVAGDPYQGLASFIWPENVLLAATCDNDVSSVPLPAMCLPWLVRAEPAVQERSFAEIPGGCWQVEASRWYSWERECERSASLIESEALPETLDQLQRLFYAALLSLGLKNAVQILERSWPQQFINQE